MSDKKTFYITTPIYYPSNKLHVGNSYTTVAADAMARFKRLTGYRVWFLTGTDEHGQKIQREAEAAGKPTADFVNEIVDWIKELWYELDIAYDDFIRTSEQRHKERVSKIFTHFYEQGDIYKGKYEGLYCTPCEAYWTERQLDEGNCPDCGRKVELIDEEAYFFRMSRYADRLQEHIESHPEFILPPSRKNEMINNFLKPGLEDLCVSRTSFDWGIPVPYDQDHVIYVWLDALSNYITALGYGDENDDLYREFWPADVQLIGKDILRFHTIYWPIFLMALGEPLPKTVFGHGWLMLQEGKMSKSKGNAIDPRLLAARYSSDALRYFLLREIPFGQDGVFSLESFITRINNDLANDLGNLVSRTLTMAERYFDGVLPEPVSSDESTDEKLRSVALHAPGAVEAEMDQMKISDALIELWELVRTSNRYIDDNMPWNLAKDPEKKDRLGTVIYNLIESIRFIAVMLQPFMPRTPESTWPQLGLENNPELQSWDSLKTWGGIKPGTVVKRGEDLFPRLNMQAELREVRGDKPAEETETREQEEHEGLITLEDFQKVDLRVAEIVAAEKVPNSDKLLKVDVNLGEKNTRQVVAGLAEHYKPEDLTGKSVLFVANLKPVKLRGVLSQGMLLAATDPEGEITLTTVDQKTTPGSRVS